MTKTKKLFVVGLVVVFASIIVLVLNNRSKTNEFFAEDSYSTRLAVLEKIPLGSPLATAQSIMEAHAFTCQFGNDIISAPKIIRDIMREVKVPDPVDVLLCASADSNSPLNVKQRWQVLFTFKNGIISDVNAAVGWTPM